MTKSQLRAKLALLKMNRREAGPDSLEEIAQVELALRDFDEFQQHEALRQAQGDTDVVGSVQPGNDLPDSEPAVIKMNEIRQKMSDLDILKAQLHQQMRAVPKAVNARSFTDKIMDVKDNWTMLGDELRFIQKNGLQTTESVTEGIRRNAPTNLFEIRHKISNLESQVTKLTDRVARVKGMADKYRYEVKLEKAKLELSILREARTNLKIASEN
jgi:hypothetical protein